MFRLFVLMVAALGATAAAIAAGVRCRASHARWSSEPSTATRR
jgi:hypothetical protein